ncbi:MAG: helix-hairpin-helix domain-containing protein [bacterium]
MAHHFKDIDRLMNAGREELLAVDEIGQIIADSVIQYFASEDHQQIINKLKESGLKMETEASETATTSQKLDGKSFVVSGVFSHYSRDEIKALIEKNGGKNVGSISSKTDFLLAGENMGPSKKEKAEKLNIPIISEEDFEKMIR